MHREVLVDVATGLRVPVDDGSRTLQREVFEFWPGELLAVFERAGLPRKSPPPFMPGTSSEVLDRTGTAPQILAPVGGTHREVLATVSSVIPLRAKVEADVREIYWFVGNAFVGKSNAASVFEWKSAPGSYELTALDDHGRAGACTISVR